MNDRYLRALRREPVDCTPVWIMRQAGRYLPEYRKTREQAGDFLTLCKTPELACEVTMQPLRRFNLDAAIVFSDILTIPDALGLGLSIVEGTGPRLERPVRSRGEVENLPEVDIEGHLGYVMDAIRLCRSELSGKVPLIGFTGSPWTLATYMVEGAGSRDFSRVKGLMHDEPETMHALLSKITEIIIRYLKGQVQAGAQALMVFDTWGGVLSTPAYATYSLEYMRRIVDALKSDSASQGVPVTLFTKGGGNWLESIAATGCDAVGLDWTLSLQQARSRTNGSVALQGNMDPAVMFASSDKVAREAIRVLDDFGDGPGHVFNLGHGIQPGVDPDKVSVLVDTVHNYGR